MSIYVKKILYGIDPRSGLGEFNDSIIYKRFNSDGSIARGPNRMAKFIKMLKNGAKIESENDFNGFIKKVFIKSNKKNGRKKPHRTRTKGARAMALTLNPYCYYCNKYLAFRPRSATIDHKIPLSKGGTNDADNTVLACETCNRDKADMTETEYLVHRKEYPIRKMGATVY